MKEFTDHQYAYGLISPLYGEVEVGVKIEKEAVVYGRPFRFIFKPSFHPIHHRFCMAYW